MRIEFPEYLDGSFPAPYDEPMGDWMIELVELDITALERRIELGEKCNEEMKMLINIRRQLCKS